MRSVILKILTSAAAFLLALCMCVSVFGSDSVSEGETDTQITEADRDTFVYGLTGYAQRDQIIRSLSKKSVAYVTQILDGANQVVAADKVVKGNYYRYSLVEGVSTFNPEAQKSYGFLGGITYDYFSEAEMDAVRQETSADGKTTPYYVVSADELLKADVIVTVGCIPLTTMKDSLGSREYKGIIISDVPSAFSDESAEDAKALISGYYIACAFSEVLDPVDVTAYYYEHFLGSEDQDSLKEKVDSVFDKTEFFRGYSNKLSDDHDKEAIEKMLIDGTYFYLDNRSIFSGGAFDTNGMSSWEPDLSLSGSILGPESAAGNSETVIDEETAEEETEAETEEETETYAETETEPEAEADAEYTADAGAGPGTSVTESETGTEAHELVFPNWIVAAVLGAVVAAGLIIYILLNKKKD